MPNTANVKKRVAKTAKRTLRNKSRKSEIKTFEKKFKADVENNDLDAAAKSLSKVTSLYDKAARHNTIHKKRANRKKSRLTCSFNKASAATA